MISFCNYVAYLPQLIAGPIERFNHLGPQLHDFTTSKIKPHFSAGIDRILLCITQKLLIADSAGNIVDRLAVVNGSMDILTSWAIAIGFGIQIYFDFAAYTHMAIGISLLLGVQLRENFLSPYQAASIQDFWRRWHVTLSSWFRDYMYIPLGGSRKGLPRTILNLLLTFLLCGLWHGAGWNFIVWGALHGIYLSVQRIKNYLFPDFKLPYIIALILTFSAVTFAWIPFRFDNPISIVNLWKGMLGLNENSFTIISTGDLAFLLVILAGTLILPNASKHWPGKTGWVESSAIASLALFAIFISPSMSKFIYFQF